MTIFECRRFEWSEIKLRDCIPPVWLRNCTQQHLYPLIVDHFATLGDYSTDEMVRGKEKLHGVRSVITSKLAAVILQILTRVGMGIVPAISIPNCIKHLILECSPVRALKTAHLHHHLPDLFCAVVGKHDGNV
jgi:hypothetical protein